MLFKMLLKEVQTQAYKQVGEIKRFFGKRLSNVLECSKRGIQDLKNNIFVVIKRGI